MNMNFFKDYNNKTVILNARLRKKDLEEVKEKISKKIWNTFSYDLRLDTEKTNHQYWE